MAQGYRTHKSTPLTDEEVKQRYKDIQDELKEVLEWKKEEEAKLDDSKASPQKKGAAKRALKKVARRIDTVKGQIIYWKLRIKGKSHFRSSIEMNEYWASCKEKADAKKKNEEENLPNLLRQK